MWVLTKDSTTSKANFTDFFRLIDKEQWSQHSPIELGHQKGSIFSIDNRMDHRLLTDGKPPEITLLIDSYLSISTAEILLFGIPIEQFYILISLEKGGSGHDSVSNKNSSDDYIEL